MKRVISVLLFILPISLFCRDLNVIKVVYTPKDFYVGDMVTLLIYVETPFDGEIESPDKIPLGEWINIKSVNLIDTGADESIIRLSFTSFAPGLRVVPDILFGDYTLHDFRINTLSIVDDRFTELQPLSPQMVPPGTNFLMVLLLCGVVLGPYLIFVLIKALLRSIKLAINKYKREKPFRRYMKILKQLKTEISEISVRGFYVKITEQLRVYLSIRFNNEFSSATTKELGSLLISIMDFDSTEELLSICRFADLVKFSHVNASSLHREKDLLTIIDILNQLEGKDNSYARF